MVGRPLTARGESVHARAMSEGGLSGGDIFFLAAPDIERRGLQSASIREGEFPRRVADLVDRIEVSGGVLIGLSARQERDRRHAGGDASFEAEESCFGDFFDSGLLRALGAGDDHVGFKDRAFEMDVLHAQIAIGDVEHGFGCFEAGVDIVGAIHEDFGFDDRDDLGFLADCGVSRERVGVSFHTNSAGHVIADFNNGAPFGEFCAEFVIFAEALAQAIEAFSDGFALRGGEWFCAAIDFDADERAVLCDQLREFCAAIGGGLSDGFVEQDDAGDMLAHSGLGLKQEFAPVAAVIFGGDCVDRGEPFGDGGVAFIGGEDALAVGGDLLRDIFECLFECLVHEVFLYYGLLYIELSGGKCGNCGQGFALKPSEERAACGGNMGETGACAAQIDCSACFAASGD